jgi:hypothetical protein
MEGGPIDRGCSQAKLRAAGPAILMAARFAPRRCGRPSAPNLSMAMSQVWPAASPPALPKATDRTTQDRRAAVRFPR